MHFAAFRCCCCDGCGGCLAVGGGGCGGGGGLFGVFGFLFLILNRAREVRLIYVIKGLEGMNKGGQTSCHPQTGLKLSKKPTSSNRFGYSHNPGGTVKTVARNSKSLKMAMRKNSPISPNIPILKYHTPILSLIGHSGNMTTAIIAASAPPAYNLVFHCGPSYSHT